MITDTRILVAEDDTSSAELLKIKLEEGGYTVKLCSNGAEALAAYKKSPYPLVITDLAMPVMSGQILIKELKAINEDQVIIVTTMHTDTEIIIETMKEGVYDYIVKPIRLDSLIPQVKRAFEADELYRTRKLLEHERMVKLENQIEWIHWNKDIINRDHDRVDKALFQSLHNSFNQGAGFGALLSLINLIAGSIDKQDDTYVVPAEIFDLIMENALTAEKTLNFFSDLSRVMTSDMPLEELTAHQLHSYIKETIETDTIIELAKYHKHIIALSEYSSDLEGLSLHINKKYIQQAIEELIKNALKFSIPGSTISVILQESGNRLTISVLNTPSKTESGIVGIPHEYQNVVFEPFFRLVKTVFEDYATLDYGLGLTLVDKIIRKHNGRVEIGNVTDYSNMTRGPVEKVMVQIIL